MKTENVIKQANDQLANRIGYVNFGLSKYESLLNGELKIDSAEKILDLNGKKVSVTELIGLVIGLYMADIKDRKKTNENFLNIILGTTGAKYRKHTLFLGIGGKELLQAEHQQNLLVRRLKRKYDIDLTKDSVLMRLEDLVTI